MKYLEMFSDLSGFQAYNASGDTWVASESPVPDSILATAVEKSLPVSFRGARIVLEAVTVNG